MPNIELTTGELELLVLWGDHFVVWEEGEEPTIKSNEEGIKSSTELHTKLFDLFTDQVMKEENIA